MLTTIDVLIVQCLELLSSIFLHSSSGSSALNPTLHDTVLQMCQIDRIVCLLCELMPIHSTELNGMISINAANHMTTQSLPQEEATDMHAVSDEHETTSATTTAHASTSTRRSDVDGGDSDDVLLSDKIAVIKASLSCDHIRVCIHLSICNRPSI